jgi:hypothetical protein
MVIINVSATLFLTMVQNHVKVPKHKPFVVGVIVKKVFYNVTSLGLLLVTRETIDARSTPT